MYSSPFTAPGDSGKGLPVVLATDRLVGKASGRLLLRARVDQSSTQTKPLAEAESRTCEEVVAGSIAIAKGASGLLEAVSSGLAAAFDAVLVFLGLANRIKEETRVKVAEVIDSAVPGSFTAINVYISVVPGLIGADPFLTTRFRALALIPGTNTGRFPQDIRRRENPVMQQRLTISEVPESRGSGEYDVVLMVGAKRASGN